jgi:putative oxidoreductase
MDRHLERYWPIPLRVLLGISFMYHGAPKLFSAEGHAQFQGMLGQLGVPLPALMSWVVGIVEFFGGIALIVGALTWLATILLSINMLVAMFLVHLPHGFAFIQITGMTDQGPVFGMPGAEVNLLYLAGLLALFIGGPGPLSVDERLMKPESKLQVPWLRHREVHA